MAQPQTATIIKQFSFSKTLYDTAQQKAIRLGLSTPEYIRHLIVQDNKERLSDSTAPSEKLSEAAEKRYLKEFLEFLKEDQKHPRPGFTSVDEMMKYLDQL